MSNILIPFFIVSIIIFKQIIAINVNILEALNKEDLLKRENYNTTFFDCELIFRANNTENLPFTGIINMEKSVEKGTILYEFITKLQGLVAIAKRRASINLFDGNWHRVTFSASTIFIGAIMVQFECLPPISLTLIDLQYLIRSGNTKTTDMKIEFQKFVLYEQIPPSAMTGCSPAVAKASSYKEFQHNLNTDNPKLDKSGCVPSLTIVRGRQVCAGELIFEDDFDIFNTSKWEHEIRIPLDSDDAEFVSYQDYPENCFIDTSNLNIMPTLLSDMPGFVENSVRMGELNLGSKCTVLIDEKIECIRKVQNFRILPPVVSAKIRTKHSFSFKYGRIDVRAKLPKGDWIFPQIHLEPLMSEYGTGNYKSGQMRIAYIRANELLIDKNLGRIDGNRLSGGAVLGIGDLFRDRWLKNAIRSTHLGDDYHVYSMIWTNESIEMLLDGVKYGSINGGFQNIEEIPHAYLWKKGDFMPPFDKEFYISFGVAVGGISDFPDYVENGRQRKKKPWKNACPKGELNFWRNRFSWIRTWSTNVVTMKVDYVKVWAL